MVNSSSYDDSNSQHHQTQDRNAKAGFKQPYNVHSDSKSPTSPCNNGFSETADSDLPSDAFAIEPTPTKTEFNSNMSNENEPNILEKAEKLCVSGVNDDLNASICCSVPLDKVQGVLTRFNQPTADEELPKCKSTRKLLCLYCDRSFVSANLRQKHVERVHSVRQNRRTSSRRQNQHLTVTPCVYCDKLNFIEKTLKDLFHHLVDEHSNRYFGCLPCEERFLTAPLLTEHNSSKHELLPQPETTCRPEVAPINSSKTSLKLPNLEETPTKESSNEEIPVKVTRSKTKTKPDDPTVSETDKVKQLVTKKKSVKLKELMNKKLSAKSTRMTSKRRESKRIQAIAKSTETQKKKRTKPSENKNKTTKAKSEQTDSTNSTEKTTRSVPACINPYPEFDNYYRVKKITDHSIDNLKISSLTFDDVFDKAFFNRIKCNIEENLLHHIDGKLFKNEESENRISNFEKLSNLPPENQNTSSENYGCEISLNAVTPVASLSLNSQFGEDFESQIEYGSKPSKKKNQIRTDEVVHYKYFTRRKFQASILQHKENRDLSKLDMWTQLLIKKRQQKMLDDKKSAKEMQEYTDGDEYKSRIRREELNRILDRRGPFEDLKEEASMKAALDKLNFDSDSVSHESFSEVREVLNEILNRVFETTESIENDIEEKIEKVVSVRVDVREIPSYLNLRRSCSSPSDEIDRSDKITLICSSQETENFELPTNQVRGKNEIVELSGEWARCRMYICAACGAKLPNMKYMVEHKSLYHQNVWVQHYEFVGNQSELYRHLSIPVLGKVGAVEESVPCKVWKRSDARVCTKCGKQCNALGELHRHILECGGDWTWMLARKKCKYRPYGTKSRRKRRGLIHRINPKRKTEPTEKKKYKRSFEGPRQRPSDADSIQRMLANLPAKRSTRKLISLHDGIYRARKKTQINTALNKKNKLKCGKVIYKTNKVKETTEKTINTTRVKLPNTSQKIGKNGNRRTLRSLNKVLASRIIDSNPKLTVKRKLRVINDKRRTRQRRSKLEENEKVADSKDLTETTSSTMTLSTENDLEVNLEETQQKRSSPRSLGKAKKKMNMKNLLTGKINIKSFFPIKKRKNKGTATEIETRISSKDVVLESNSNRDAGDGSKTGKTENEQMENVQIKSETKKLKNDTFGKLVRSLSLNKTRAKKLEENHSGKNKKHSKCKDETTSIKETIEDEKQVKENSNKKRKLKQSFRNVINRVKKLKIDNEITNSSSGVSKDSINDKNEICQSDPFLGKSKQNDKLDPCAQPEKIVIPSTIETRENVADISETAPIVMNYNENDDRIPERIFSLELNNEKSLQAKGELDFDTQPVAVRSQDESTAVAREIEGLTQSMPDLQPISIETSVKSKVVPLVSPNMKGKIRKPARGLNDCIAMLTSKLQQKAEGQVDNSTKSLNKSINLPPSPNVFRPFIDMVVPKPDCILKIPNFKTPYTDTEETALDLSMKSQSNPELNSDVQHDTFWQARPPNFLFPGDFAKPLWIPPAPIQSSIDKTIEEVIEDGYKKQLCQDAPKSRYRWNSVDEIIQNVVDGYKNTSTDTKLIKVIETPKARNTIDDIIDFVIASNSIEDEIDKLQITDIVTDSDASKEKIHGNAQNNSPPLVTPESEKQGTNILRSENNIQEKSSDVSPASAAKEENVNKNKSKIAKQRTIRRNNGKSKLVAESPEKGKEAQSLELDKITVSEGIYTTVSIENSVTSNPDDQSTNIFESNDRVDESQLEDNKKCQNSPDLNNAFIHLPEKAILGNKANSKKGRKIGQVRNNTLKKKSAKGKLLETNVDNLLNFEEINKAEVSVTHLGTVSIGEIQKPEIKLTTEDEPHLLESKMLLTKSKSVAPSDSEDEIPLSALIRADSFLSIDEHNNEKQAEKTTYDEKTTEEINPINCAKEKTLKVEKIVEDVQKTVVPENSVQLEQIDDSIEDPLNSENVDDGTKNVDERNEIISDENLEDTSENLSEKSTKTHTTLKRNKNQEKGIKPKLFSEQDTDIFTEQSTPIQNVDDTVSKPSTNTPNDIFKTPKKLRKSSLKQVSRRRSLGRKTKNGDIPKRTRSLGDPVSTANSEPDTDDESLLSIKMTLKLKYNNSEKICDTVKLVDKIEHDTENAPGNIDNVIKYNLPLLCSDKSGSPDNASEKLFPFLDENNSSTVANEGVNEKTNKTEKFDEEKSLDTNSHDSSITLDKSDTTNFFDSGISDESLENVDQREKIVIMPKRRGRKPKANKNNTKSGQISCADKESNGCNSILNDVSLLMKIDSSISNDAKETSDTIQDKRRISRSMKRNSEIDFSDSSNSVFDISNENVPDVEKNPELQKNFPPLSPLTINKENIEGKFQETIQSKEIETELKNISCINLPSEKNVDEIRTDLKIATDINLEPNLLEPIDGFLPKTDNFLNVKSNAASVIKSKNLYKKKISKAKLKRSVLNSKVKDSCDKIYATENLTEGAAIQDKITAENINEIASAILQKDLSETLSDTIIDEKLSELKESVTHFGVDLREDSSDKKMVNKNPVVPGSSKKQSRRSRFSNASKVSTSVPSELNNPIVSIENTNEGVRKKSIKESKSFRQIKKPDTYEDEIPKETEQDNSVLSMATDNNDLSGRRSRSARNKVINYAENDDNEATTPKELSLENSPEKLHSEIESSLSIKPILAPRKLELKNDPEAVNKQNQRDDLPEKVKVKENKAPPPKIIFTARTLRKRKVKRKQKILRKRKINRKRKKNVSIKVPSDAVELSIINEVNCSSENPISLEKSPEFSNTRSDIPEKAEFLNDVPTESQYILEKTPEVNGSRDNITVIESIVTNDTPAIIKEPPIKIIINKQKTRRKSKSFRKVDIKGQNDLFKDFALVIKKTKRLAPIITFTPTDSILKETYPNLVKIPTERPIESEKTIVTDTITNENLDESVEEMDMELEEIPLTTNIIERNTLPDIEKISISDNNLDKAAKKNKPRKIKRKKTRFSRKKNPKTIHSIDTVISQEEIHKNPEVNTNFSSEIKGLGDPPEIKIVEITNANSEKDCDIVKPEIEKIKESLNTSTDVQPNLGSGEIPYEDISEENAVFTKTNKEIPVEQAVSRLAKTKRRRKNKVLRKKIVINLGKNKKNIVDNFKFSSLKKNKSVNNNLLFPKQIKTDDQLVTTSLSVILETKNATLSTLELKSSDTDEIDSGRKLRSAKSEDISPQKILKESCPSDIQTKEDIPLKETIEIEPLMKYTSTPIKETLQTDQSKAKDPESIYNFTESDDSEIEKPLEISKRLPRKKGKSLSEFDEPLEKIDFNSKTVNIILENQTLTKSSMKKNRSLSESAKLPDDSAEISKALSSENIGKVSNDLPLEEVKTNDIQSDDTTQLLTSKVMKVIASVEQISSITNGVLNDNMVQTEDNARRKSVRSAKVKALEHIHDEALAELTESERNREISRSKVISSDENERKNGKKKQKTPKVPKILPTLDFKDKILEEDKPPSFADLVADLAGLEELENSIERELNAENEFTNEDQTDLEVSTNEQVQENLEKSTIDTVENDNQELRRSRRGSKKIASYNENDLIDPLLDAVDKKKKSRKKDLDNGSQDGIIYKKINDGKNINSDELFDLLKSSNKSLPVKPLNSFANIVCQFSGNSDNNETDKKKAEDVENIYEFSESPENSKKVSLPNNKRTKTSKNSTNKSLLIDKSLSSDNVDNSASNTSFQEKFSHENSPGESSTKLKADGKDSNFCEICNKSFIRVENLNKHKRTLTHIQKLSEIEAKQEEEKSKLNKTTLSEEPLLNPDKSPATFDSPPSDINIHNILQVSDKPKESMSEVIHPQFSNNDSLKLADIISDVLNKPSLGRDNKEPIHMETQQTNEVQPELRRYKSLGERKSFDSDMLTTEHNEPYISKTTILEKQISLLENIIENQGGVSYIDDISISSNNSIIDNSGFSSKQGDSNNPHPTDKNITLSNLEDSFLKPTQYEEISEDSINIRNYEDQKLRKTLNRDEELFLECCSLLKSGSEVSSYSNQRSQKIMNRLGMKQFDEPESMEGKSIQQISYGLENEYSDGNSRIPTPLGDSYDDDASDSNTISSNWDINKMEPVFEDNPRVSSNLNFQQVLNKAMNQDIHCNFRKSPAPEETQNSCNEKDETTNISKSKKKIITKGARKVFEGLKVSIPTEELNLEEVLNCSPKCKKPELVPHGTSDDQSVPELMNSPQKPSRNARKSKPVKKAHVGSDLLFKVKKKKSQLSPGITTNAQQEYDKTKSIDVYDFEETQDNTDVFPKPDFRAFRTKKSNENPLELESDSESRDDYLESFIGQPESVTSSQSSSSSTKKSKAHESITKKKCMIMGRIFKNHAKSKIEDIDEEMRDIPEIGNEELVENYVANCKFIRNDMKPKLSETEINQLFDQLLENKDIEKDGESDGKGALKLKTEIKDKEKKTIENRKKKFKNRKRARTNSESTDDEFNLSKSNKRVYRKNGKNEDNSINLEQELKECIGVASRKSQRKCTSGKQNVLVEYWSSDESQFEALLETQKIENKPKLQPHQKISADVEVKPPANVPKEANVIKSSEVEFKKVPTILKPPPRPKPLKKSQTKRKNSSEKDKTLNLHVTVNSSKTSDQAAVNRRKRAAVNPLYHWSSSSEDESQDLIEVKPIREDEEEFEDDRPIQHGWIVGESPKKLVTMLAQAKGKKLTDIDCVKEQGKKRTNHTNS